MALQEQDKRMFLSYNFFGGGHNIDVVFICVIVSFIFAHLVTGQGESLKCPILQKTVIIVDCCCKLNKNCTCDPMGFEPGSLQ